MLTNALRALINNPFKESFYKKKKSNLCFGKIFFFLHKSDVITFLK